MGTEAESDPRSIPKLPRFSVANKAMAMAMQEPPEAPSSGAQTPPLQTIASVPFRWEEEPGKPRPCTALVAISKSSSARCLDPPPKFFFSDLKLAPTTVLDGPYYASPGCVFQSSSFRVTRDRRHSFRSGSVRGVTSSPERGVMVLGRRRFFGGWRRKNHKGKREAFRSLDLEDGGSAAEADANADAIAAGEGCESEGGRMMRTRRSGSSMSLSNTRSPFWASVYEGLKQVMPWKRTTKKLKKDGGLLI